MCLQVVPVYGLAKVLLVCYAHLLFLSSFAFTISKPTHATLLVGAGLFLQHQGGGCCGRLCSGQLAHSRLGSC